MQRLRKDVEARGGLKFLIGHATLEKKQVTVDKSSSI